MRWTPKRWNRTRRVGPRPWPRTCDKCGIRFAFESAWRGHRGARFKVWAFICGDCGPDLNMADEWFREHRANQPRRPPGGPVPPIFVRPIASPKGAGTAASIGRAGKPPPPPAPPPNRWIRDAL